MTAAFHQALDEAGCAIVCQARMSSKRLPGKMLRPLCGTPLLQFVLDRIDRGGLKDRFWLATSSECDDDPLAAYAERRQIRVFRGDLNDVTLRFIQLAGHANLRSIIRISGDSPFLDLDLVARVFECFRPDLDLATNVFPRTFPKGQSVEVISVACLVEHHDRMTPEEREHVTPYFYRHAEQFRILNHAHPVNLGHVRMVVDTEEDWRRCESLVSGLTRPASEYSWQELAAQGKWTGTTC